MGDNAITDTDINEIYEIKEVLGKGAFSQVKKCVHRESGAEFAVKVIDLRRVPPNEKAKIKREARICLMVNHPNIVKLHEVYEAPHTYFMVFELVSGGELFEDIVRRTFYSERDASHLMLQILSAMQHLHRLEIVHRDLKPENLLLESQRDGADIKLTDFGLAVMLEKQQNEWFGFAGTPGYLSPEVVKRVPYGKPVDMWAIGIILYILLAGYPPFWDDDTKVLYEQIKLGEYEYPSPDWDDVSSEARDLIDRLLVQDPAKRLTVDQALAHPWIAQSDRVAPHVHRQGTIEEMKRFNARRKFKGAIFTAIATNKLLFGSKSILEAAKKAASGPADGSASSSAGDAAAAAALANLTIGTPTSAAETPSEKHLESVETLIQPPRFQDATEEEVYQLTVRLLEAIHSGDYGLYAQLSDVKLTAFEPEAQGILVQGLEFHRFYLEAAKATRRRQGSVTSPGQHTFHPYSTIENPQVRILASGSAAVILYNRLTMSLSADTGKPTTHRYQETRIWEKHGTTWKQVHFHRSS
ncbi:calcium/calmodulin-dependent protein kinase II gamma M subunit [Capsaspora owczarzaki ATCC 30864]|uniref:calcium/calmodulin-dependent protein kinase n=1 Tax=Capsaspora owczarzaki (strain ATCC 30864) TaxID=595528 RepID=A0A0D2US79_CAPO3|nr:calcium/calmodulin-dependent protein kinase II gamma M subunit [Capsaspora owczarzaki ATCC 30864]KJE97821.1 CAMK/CAMK2 protein kinase [Capsaspora owczarzaki ATCC 30864]|eukprot:XP_004343000.2 calcium/calmodulin-dependent protein kinase II gamma M subunit [Capsaspora owczarzaki ATCC 30864]